jgi:hypothetical protein
MILPGPWDRGCAVRSFTPAVAAVLLLGLTSAATGQVLRGRLLDLRTNEPITGGVISLIRNDGKRVASVITGDDGSYRLAAPDSGSYFVEARRIGYQISIDGPIELRDGDDWETAYHLTTVPLQLAPVGVHAPGNDRWLERVGFHERERAEFGHFITRPEIEARSPRVLTELLSLIPGVRVVQSSGGLTRAGIELRGSVLSQGGTCHPRVFVDGLVVIRGDARLRGTDLIGLGATETQGDPAERPEIALNDVVMPEDIQAIEVYRSAAQVPVRFGGGAVGTQCGVIVIWTRRGRRGGP